jgi:hypothetical protein
MWGLRHAPDNFRYICGENEKSSRFLGMAAQASFSHKNGLQGMLLSKNSLNTVIYVERAPSIGLNFAALHRQWWRLHSETFLSGT